MDLATRYQVSGPNIIHEAFEDEVILLNLNNGNYYSLVQVAADVWNLIQTGATTAAILAAIAQRYEGSVPEIERTVTQFILQLQQENLIIAGDSTPSHCQQGNTAEDAVEPAGVRLPFQAPTLHKFSDMREMLLLDPIHEVDESGWPGMKQAPSTR